MLKATALQRIALGEGRGGGTAYSVAPRAIGAGAAGQTGGHVRDAVLPTHRVPVVG